MRSFFVKNFGCRATQADGAALERRLLGQGLSRAPDARQAEIVVLNSCTVTGAADQDVRNTIRRIHRQNPGAQILVTGCYAQRAPGELAAIEGVTWVVGNSHKHEVANLLRPGGSGGNFVPLEQIASPTLSPTAGDKDGPPRTTGDKGGPPTTTGSKGRAATVLVGDIFAHTELLAAPVFDSGAEKTRPNLKLQDGCDNRCSFCVIPFVRGRNRSLPLEEAVREVNGLVDAGYREIVLSGINLGRWGRELLGNDTFVGLLRAILERTSIERIRISSVEPMDWTDELIALVAASPRIARHAHVPLQSGSDRVLRLMHRRYRPWHYAEKLRRIRAAMPEAAIGADVMVGFPGETEELFAENRRFIAELPFTYLHVFTFSARPGTPAATMKGQVAPRVMKERNRVLRALAAGKNLAFRESFVGRELSAITLHQGNEEFTEALSDNYLKVTLRGRHPANRMVEAHIEAIHGDGLLACVETPEERARTGGARPASGAARVL